MGTEGSGDKPRSIRQRIASWRRHRDSVLITDAKTTRAQDRQQREKWYGILQFIRVPLMVACVWMYFGFGWVWFPAILAALTIPLPWIAVMIANLDGTPQDKRAPRVYKPAAMRQAQARARRELEGSETHPDERRQLPPTIDHDDKQQH